MKARLPDAAMAEMFECERLRCRISRTACAERHRTSRRGAAAGAGQRRDPFPVCRTCPIGAAHVLASDGRGPRPEVRLVTVRLPEPPAPRAEPNLPATTARSSLTFKEQLIEAERRLGAIDAARKTTKKQGKKKDAARRPVRKTLPGRCLVCDIELEPRRKRCPEHQREYEYEQRKPRRREAYRRARQMQPKVRRVGMLIEHAGRSLTITGWSRELGISIAGFIRRLDTHGPERAVAMGAPSHAAGRA